MTAGVASLIASPGEYAAQMLVKAEVGFPGDAGGIGIQSLKKILDLLLNLHTARCRDRRLDLTVHFGLPTHPFRNSARASEEALTVPDSANTCAADKFRLRGKNEVIQLCFPGK